MSSLSDAPGATQGSAAPVDDAKAREVLLHEWVAQQLNLPEVALHMVSGDASFRRYFRVRQGDSQWIIMDAPPEKEDSTSFVAIARFWREANIEVPELVAVDLDLGFLILSDMGDDLLLSALNADNPDVAKADVYYSKALNVLTQIQQVGDDSNYPLPPYDRALLTREMDLFTDWLCGKKLGISFDEGEHEMLAHVYEMLIDNALTQAQVPVHRDYHSRNLMILSNDEIGVLDYQDAVQGPITYDLVSLLRDCYIVWPNDDVERWCRAYYDLAKKAGLTTASYDQFVRWFDLMGMQRHLKASGIFARLSLRDGKHGYLLDIPRTVNYIVRVSAKYEELALFNTWLKDVLVPKLDDLRN